MRVRPSRGRRSACEFGDFAICRPGARYVNADAFAWLPKARIFLGEESFVKLGGPAAEMKSTSLRRLGGRGRSALRGLSILALGVVVAAAGPTEVSGQTATRTPTASHLDRRTAADRNVACDVCVSSAAHLRLASAAARG